MSEGTSKRQPVVYLLSDSAGETGESVIRAAAAQFHPTAVAIRRLPFVSNKEAIDHGIAMARKEPGVVAYTLVINELRDYLIERCMESGIPFVDLLGPMVSSLEGLIGKESSHQPGIRHRLDADYFRRIEAVEFAVKYDDGRDPQGILKADIVLLGVSRTSKTPLSMYLAHQKYKVANVPLVPEIRLPEELLHIPVRKIVGLSIDPDKLNIIRKERLKSLGLTLSAQYADRERIRKELAYAEEMFRKIRCIVIDVSAKAVEETAGVILEHLKDTKPTR